MEIEEILREKLKEFGLSEEALQKCAEFASLLISENEKFNLTSIKEPEDVAVKHFADSLKGLKYIKGGSLADVGSGAGFPGIPIAIARPELSATLIDSVGKKTAFQNAAASKLSLKNVRALNGRAEVLSGGALREKFDTATVRALSGLKEIAEIALPLLKTGGVLIVYKGGSPEEETKAAEGIIAAAGGEIRAIDKFSLDEKYERSLIIVDKIRKTPESYPRDYKFIKEKKWLKNSAEG
jgi:16S rRNA (guanine(527)-N(7))-methyltransferase GidB